MPGMTDFPVPEGAVRRETGLLRSCKSGREGPPAIPHSFVSAVPGSAQSLLKSCVFLLVEAMSGKASAVVKADKFLREQDGAPAVADDVMPCKAQGFRTIMP